MKNLSLLAFGLFMLFMSCESYNGHEILKKESVVVHGKIENFDSKYFTITFQDIVRGQANYTHIIDTLTGTFSFIFDIYHGQDIRFEYDKVHFRLFVQPSDSLFLSFDAQNIIEGNYIIEVAGNNEKINEEIQKFNAFKKVTPFNPDCEGKSVKQYQSELKKQIEKELNELNLFVKEFNPSEKFIHWAQNDIIYNNANYLIHYKAYLSYSNLPKTDSILKTGIFPIENPHSLISSMFGLHLWHYASDMYIQNNVDVISFINDKNYFDAYKTSIESLLLNEKEGIIRDIMVYKLMTFFFNESFSDFERFYKSDNYEIGNPLLVSELGKRLQEAKESTDHNIISIDDITKIENELLGDLFDILIKESVGKTLYLDFWATWCGPCRDEIPKLIELHERIKDENIDIVSICCNSDRSTWSVIINDNRIPGKHYFLDKKQTDLIKSKFKFQGYPTYMIIKDGIIKNKKAARPSSGEKIINELIRINAL